MAQRKSLSATGFDKPLLFFVIITCLYGILAIFTATHSLGTLSNVIIQSAAFGLGMVLLLILTIFDFEQFAYLVKYIYAASVLLLVLVLLIGEAGTWGAKSWIRFGPVGIQPAEIAKVAFIITFSYHLTKVQEHINKLRTLLLLLVHMLVIVGLILLQPDLGSSLVFFFMFFVMLFVAGLSYKYILAVLGLGVVMAPLAYFFVLSPYQQHRIQVFFNPDLDPLGSGYNVIQSKIAVGSGQLFGKGLLQGTQNQMGFLPTKSTDFIFSVIAEELGFIGAVAVVALLFIIIFRCIRVARGTTSLFGRYICTGVAAMLIFHTFENIGMCIGLMPVTGIPLPFISYGGTSLVTNLIAVGLVLSVSLRNKKQIF